MEKQKTGLIIGASRDAIHTIEVAKRYGIKIVAIDGNPEAEGLEYADEYIVVDISNRDKVCEIVSNIKPDFVLPIPIGRYLSMTGYVNEKFHLPGIQYDETELSVDKYLFHKKLNENGLRNIQLYIVNQSSDLDELAINYPAVLKPRYGSGSRDVFYLTDRKELAEAFQKIKCQKEDFVLEQAVEGVEYGVDGAVIDGQLYVTLIRKKINTPLPVRQAISYLTVTNIDENIKLKKVIYEYLNRVEKVLKYKNCLIHADIIVKDYEPFVIEISPRPSGHNLHNLFVPLATGIDIAEEYIRYILGLKFSFEPQYTKCLQIRFFDFENVIVKEIPDEEMLRKSKQCNLIYWKCNIKSNEKMHSVINGKSIMGRGLFVVEGEDRKDLMKQSAWILSQFKLEGEKKMDYQENNKKFWDEHFSKVSLDYPNEEVVRFLARCRKIYPNGVLLDWGCATGRHTVLGCKFGFSVIAADYVERCVDITRRKVEKECNDCSGKVISYIVNQDVDVEKIENNAVDVIVAWGILFYNSKEKQQLMLNNIRRMLKKGGRAFVDFRTEHDSIYVNQKEKTEEGFVVDYEDASVAGNYMDILPFNELQEMFENSGLKVENVELYEFTEHNRTRQNSWWHVTLLKE